MDEISVYVYIYISNVVAVLYTISEMWSHVFREDTNPEYLKSDCSENMWI
jgi:hypothetical protein